MNLEEGFSPRVDAGVFNGTLDALVEALQGGAVDPATLRVAEVCRQVVEQLPASGSVPAEEELEAVSGSLALLARVVAAKVGAVVPRLEDAEVASAEDGVENGAEEPPGELDSLAERVAAYRVFREAAEELRRLETSQAERFPGRAEVPARGRLAERPELSLDQLLAAFRAVWERTPPEAAIGREAVTVARRMEEVMARLAAAAEPVTFTSLFPAEAGRREVVVTFLALLELVRRRLVRIWQEEAFGEIRVEAVGGRS